jgi:hypothetical protein
VTRLCCGRASAASSPAPKNQEQSPRQFVVAPKSQGEEHEADSILARSNSRDLGVRVAPCRTGDADLPGRIGRCCDHAVPAAATTASSGNADLPGWIGDPGDVAVPGSAASATAASGAEARRARLS